MKCKYKFLQYNKNNPKHKWMEKDLLTIAAKDNPISRES